MVNNIKDYLNNIISYYSNNRRIGHTTVVLKGVNNHKSIVVYPSKVIADSFKSIRQDGYIDLSLSELNTKLLGMKLPLVFDHSTLTELFSESLHEINRLQEEVDDLRMQLNAKT